MRLYANVALIALKLCYFFRERGRRRHKTKNIYTKYDINFLFIKWKLTIKFSGYPPFMISWIWFSLRGLLIPLPNAHLITVNSVHVLETSWAGSLALQAPNSQFYLHLIVSKAIHIDVSMTSVLAIQSLSSTLHLQYTC